MSIGERLKEFINIEYKTQISFAEQIKASPQNINAYVTGRIEPGATILSKLANLGLNINWLLTGRGTMLLIDNEDLLQNKAQNILNETKKLIEKELGVSL